MNDAASSPHLAAEVARQLTHHDALGAHVRDELGITDVSLARPIQAALSSAAAFTVGALLPLLAAVLSSSSARIPVIAAATLIALATLGAIGARLGGAPLLAASVRITVLGALAMAVTAAIGAAVGTTVG